MAYSAWPGYWPINQSISIFHYMNYLKRKTLFSFKMLRAQVIVSTAGTSNYDQSLLLWVAKESCRPQDKQIKFLFQYFRLSHNKTINITSNWPAFFWMLLTRVNSCANLPRTSPHTKLHIQITMSSEMAQHSNITWPTKHLNVLTLWPQTTLENSRSLVYEICGCGLQWILFLNEYVIFWQALMHFQHHD